MGVPKGWKVCDVHATMSSDGSCYGCDHGLVNERGDDIARVIRSNRRRDITTSALNAVWDEGFMRGRTVGHNAGYDVGFKKGACYKDKPTHRSDAMSRTSTRLDVVADNMKIRDPNISMEAICRIATVCKESATVKRDFLTYVAALEDAEGIRGRIGKLKLAKEKLTEVAELLESDGGVCEWWSSVNCVAIRIEDRVTALERAL